MNETNTQINELTRKIRDIELDIEDSKLELKHKISNKKNVKIVDEELVEYEIANSMSSSFWEQLSHDSFIRK